MSLLFTVKVTIFPAGQENGFSTGALLQTRPEAPKLTLLQIGVGGVAAIIRPLSHASVERARLRFPFPCDLDRTIR
jgi:hypothetical protein